ncbi:MAG: VOC family protein [Gemmatimonadota bacterium]
MGVTSDGIFGEAESEPATAGSYGEPPNGFRLPSGTRLGPVRLRVADAGRSVAFYESVLGLRVLDRSASQVMLGTQGDDVPLVELHEKHGIRPSPHQSHLGLYHFAILLPDRPSLGRFLRHLGEIDARAGAADHLVSESLYLQDPDNLGIEIYADRPRSRWRRIGKQLKMATDPLDVPGIIREAGDTAWGGMPPGSVMGHLHLHVGDLARAGLFYSEGIGLDRTVWQYPGALFMAADGYHHHLGTNTWAGPDAHAPGPDTAQLLEWTMVLPDSRSLDAVAENLNRGKHAVERDNNSAHGDSLRVKDPWGTALRIQL